MRNRRRRTARSTIALLLLVLAAPLARADSWMPFRGMRRVDATGHRYVVIEPKGSDASYQLVRAAEGSDAVPEIRDAVAEVRSGDAVLARGSLPFTPVDVIVLPAGSGFVLLDVYGNLGYGDVVSFIGESGARGPSLALNEIFPDEECEAFLHTASSIWWRVFFFNDTATTEIVLVSHSSVRAVRWSDGRVRKTEAEDIVRALRDGDPRRRQLALDVAITSLPKELALEAGRRIQPNPREPLTLRLRAAILLAHHGDTSGKTLIHSTAFDPPDTVSAADRDYAIEVSGMMLGAAAIEPLRALLRGPAGPHWGSALDAFASIGEAAVPTLITMLEERSESADYCGGAAHVLAKIGSRHALDALLRAISDPREFVANAAANAAISIGGESIVGRLIEVLAQGSTQDSRIASALEKWKHPGAAEALLAAWDRTGDRFTIRTIREALRFQTGVDHGDDPRTWRESLGIR
ncbi:MAG: hypothetical protein KDC38_08840 [Planctomycetes bacterium]|nr:hypothetical protein [Planctomycetota bacterium]